jgi:hypothetical protein
MLTTSKFHLWLLLPLLLFFGCATQGVKLDPDALYYRLGARKQLGKIVTDVVDSWYGDQRLVGNAAIREKLSKTDSGLMKRTLFSFVCWASNGPCTFRAESLDENFKDMGVTPVEWYYMLEAVVGALNKHSVPLPEQNELMEIIYGLQGRVVGR